MFASIILFVYLTLSMGYCLTFFLNWSSTSIEKIIIRLGVGLSGIITLGVLLNLLHISIDWKIFVAITTIANIIITIIHRKKITTTLAGLKNFKPTITKENLYSIGAILLFAIALFMYAGGAFSYPYLENEDPWTHAGGVSYIAHEKTLDEPTNYNFKFLDPYPPGFEMWLGLLHQVEPSISTVLKFFNALFISLGIFFSYFMFKKLGIPRHGALIASFALLAIPSFFTHFIWAHTLSIILFFIAIYCLESIHEDKKWTIPAAFTIAGIFMTHPDEGLKIAVLIGLYIIVKSIYYKTPLYKETSALMGGFILSLLWWATHAAAVLGKHTTQILASGKYATIQNAQGTLLGLIQKYFPPNQGTATRAYTLKDFAIAEPFGMINVHVGWGIAITGLLVCALIYILWKHRQITNKENYWIGVAIVWFIFTFLGTNSMTFNLPIGLYAFRFWLLLAIPVAMLTWLGVELLIDMGKKVKLPHITSIIIIAIIVAIFFTSFTAKYNQNHNAQFPPGVSWSNMQEVQLYVWLKTALPAGTKVYSINNKGAEIIGMDKFSCEWCPAVQEFRKTTTMTNPNKFHAFLKTQGYEYTVFEVGTVNVWIKQNQTQEQAIKSADTFINDLANSGKFEPVQQIQGGGIVFKVK